MNQRTLLTLVLPGAIPLCGVATLLVLASPATIQQAAGTYPFVALAAALFLAARFQRSRIFALTLALLTAAYALRVVSPAWQPLAHALAATLLPVAAALLVPLRDASVGTRRAFVQSFIVACIVMAALLAAAGWPEELARLLHREFIDPIYTSWTGLQQPALLLWLPAAGTMILVTARRRRAAEAGLLAAAGFAALALAWPAAAERGAWLLAAGAALLVALVESSREMALHDELTGLPARRALAQTLETLRPPYTIAIVDVDHFKTFNDRYGHDVGDQVLRMVAVRLDAVRDGTAYRSGGEEFTVVFPGLDKEDAAERMEEVRRAVERATFTLRGAGRPRTAKGAAQRGRSARRERKIGVTISVGLAAPGARVDTTSGVVKAADKAMYRAKQDGRNRVVA